MNITKKRIYDGTIRRWGHMIEQKWGTDELEGGRFKVQGVMTPVPVKGDLIRLKTGMFEFEEVQPRKNPPDLFFGTIKPVKEKPE